MATPAHPANSQQSGGAPFDFTQADERPGRARRTKKPASPWLWVAVVIVAVVLLVGGVGGVVLHAIATERHQMDSLYSEYTDKINDSLLATKMISSDPELTGEGAHRGMKKIGDEIEVVSEARGKLWNDYLARFGTDPKYVKKWDDRARPNPMRSRYPIPSQ